MYNRKLNMRRFGALRYLYAYAAFALAVLQLSGSVHADDMMVSTGPEGDAVSVYSGDGSTVGPDLEVTVLDSSVRSVQFDTVRVWSLMKGLADDGLNADDPCPWSELFRCLWKLKDGVLPEGRAVSDDPLETRYLETEQAVTYAVHTGMASSGEVRQKMLYSLTVSDALRAVWQASGCPAPLAVSHALPAGMYAPYELWACDIGLVTKEEQPYYNGSEVLTEGKMLTLLYYLYNRRKENSFPITVDQFLESCRNVTVTARMRGYRYGDSHAADPTTDGIISCDRLVAKALYDLGYTDQPIGGITCGNADEYLSAWGFERGESMYDIRTGSILLVRHMWASGTDHMFVAAGPFDFGSMTCDRYDCGSQGFIEREQPLRSLRFTYDTDHVIVYNIPG